MENALQIDSSANFRKLDTDILREESGANIGCILTKNKEKIRTM